MTVCLSYWRGGGRGLNIVMVRGWEMCWGEGGLSFFAESLYASSSSIGMDNER
jgi:hypothetical protein